MVPDHLLIHTVDVITPATSIDTYGNTVYDYDSGTFAAVTCWLQQNQRSEQFRDGRDPLDERWLMITNNDNITSLDRIRWTGHPHGAITFDVDGPPEPVYRPGDPFHHTELTLRRTRG